MVRKIISVDLVPAEYRAVEMGFPYFPLKDFISYFKNVMNASQPVDILETYVTLQRRVPENDSYEALAQVEQQVQRKCYALEMNGGRVIECPSKRSPNSASGFKQSDDQRLIIRTLVQAMKLKPDYLILVGADGDYAPMVEALRDEGIRTEVVAAQNSLAGDLARVAVEVIDLDMVLGDIKRRGRY